MKKTEYIKQTIFRSECVSAIEGHIKTASLRGEWEREIEYEKAWEKKSEWRRKQIHTHT